MKRDITIVSIVSLYSSALLSSLAVAKDPTDVPPPPSASVIVLKRCLIGYQETTRMASPLSSVLQDCLVREGDRVKAGQVIGRLFDQDVRAQMDMQAAVAANDTQLRLTKAEHEWAVLKLKKSQQLHDRRFVSPEELSMDRLSVEKARLAVETAEHQQRLSQFELRQAAAEVRAREFVAPHDAVVVEVNKTRGESVTPTESIFYLVNTDRLKVTGALNINDAWRTSAGQKVRIYPEIAGADLDVEREVFTGQIVFVDSLIDSETQTCKVIAEIDNRENKLKSGIEARMEISTEDAKNSKVNKASAETRPNAETSQVPKTKS